MIMTAMVMLVDVTTILVFTNDVILESFNGIRPDRTWIKHNLGVGLRNLLGSQELGMGRTNNMAWMSGLDKAETKHITRELEFSGSGTNQIDRVLEYSRAKSKQITWELELSRAESKQDALELGHGKAERETELA